MNRILSDQEKVYDRQNVPLNRAGQVLTFHPGEQVHCGVSTNYKCSLTGDVLPERVVMFVDFVPQKFYNKVRNLKLFHSEYPWGLQKGGIQTHQVISLNSPFFDGAKR